MGAMNGTIPAAAGAIPISAVSLAENVTMIITMPLITALIVATTMGVEREAPRARVARAAEPISASTASTPLASGESPRIACPSGAVMNVAKWNTTNAATAGATITRAKFAFADGVHGFGTPNASAECDADDDERRLASRGGGERRRLALFLLLDVRRSQLVERVGAPARRRPIADTEAPSVGGRPRIEHRRGSTSSRHRRGCRGARWAARDQGRARGRRHRRDRDHAALAGRVARSVQVTRAGSRISSGAGGVVDGGGIEGGGLRGRRLRARRVLDAAGLIGLADHVGRRDGLA